MSSLSDISSRKCLCDGHPGERQRDDIREIFPGMTSERDDARAKLPGVVSERDDVKDNFRRDGCQRDDVRKKCCRYDVRGMMSE